MKILEIENRENSRNGEQVIKKQKEKFPGLKKHMNSKYSSPAKRPTFPLTHCQNSEVWG